MHLTISTFAFVHFSKCITIAETESTDPRLMLNSNHNILAATDPVCDFFYHDMAGHLLLYTKQHRKKAKISIQLGLGAWTRTTLTTDRIESLSDAEYSRNIAWWDLPLMMAVYP